MSDFKIIPNKIGGYIIFAPKRSKRPDESEKFFPVCPFCIGNEQIEEELFRVGGKRGYEDWDVRVLKNKFPFAPIHEIIIHSPDHHKNIDELPLDQVNIIISVFKERFNKNKKNGSVFIFSNHGEMAGESIPHPHTQLVVYPQKIDFVVPKLVNIEEERIETSFFFIYCPHDSQWIDEVWIVPKELNKTFGQITDNEIKDLSFVLQRLIQIFILKHGHEFPFNFYIYPKENWYLRFIPREKKLGGMEIVSNLFVNTGNPNETIQFIIDKF